jgi:two-component system NtrC family sensor kinase
MKKIAAALLLLCTCLNLSGQSQAGRLSVLLSRATSDTARISLLVELSRDYYLLKPDSGFYYASKALAIAKKTGNTQGEVHALTQAAFSMWLLGNRPAALQTFYSSLHIAEQINDQWSVARNYDGISCIYADNGELGQAVTYGLKSEAIFSKLHDYENTVDELMDLADFYRTSQLDSSLIYAKKALALSMRIHETTWHSQIFTTIGADYLAKGNKELALRYLHQSITMSAKYNEPYNLINGYTALVGIYIKYNVRDSSIFYAKKAFDLSQKGSFSLQLQQSAAGLAELYYGNNDRAAAQYYHIATALRDSLFNVDNARQVLVLNITEQQHEADLKNAAIAYQNKLKLYGLLGMLAFVVVILIITWNNKEKKAKANKLLENQKQQVQQTLQELRQTQTQLIQSEKMASLGELTAGIAHEIQNPLNFVNNFSEVNKEMLEELKAESEKPKAKRDEQLEIDLINDLIENERKINHHGKRADAIVKGMLQHSQTGKGTKEPTGINSLAEERLRLAYHAMQSKSPDFHAEMSTSFDAGLPMINVIPQDIGKVLLNLYNNAFYAVNQKLKTAGPDYKPEVSVATLAENGNIIIKVKDNGDGIPDAIKDKIMQPFFTTKPTGEGTGLGLSLSYDIIVKGHGGSINVDTNEGEGSEFMIILPIS